MPTPSENPSLRIAILAFPGCMGSEILAINDVLLLAGHIARAQRGAPVTVSTVEVVGLSGRPVPLAGGLTLAARRPSGHYDVVIVPGLEISQLNDWDAKLAPLQRELAFIRKSFASGSAIASVCVGSFLLAEAGLLDQRKATTAWLCVPQLVRRYPAVAVQPDAVMVEDGAVLTTGAVSSAFDLAILLIKRTLGARVATATARVALLSAQRVSQAPYVDAALIAPGLPSFSQSVGQWLQSRLTEVYDMERLAQAFHVSSRTLLRRVKAETGRSPLVLLQQARIDKAKQLLLETRWSQDRITEAVGYADTGTFARLFSSQVGVSPARFRRQGL